MRNDKDFQKLLNRLHSANTKYREILEEAENAYKLRYGQDASNNDKWIDSFCVGNFKMTSKELDQSLYDMPDQMAYD